MMDLGNYYQPDFKRAKTYNVAYNKISETDGINIPQNFPIQKTKTVSNGNKQNNNNNVLNLNSISDKKAVYEYLKQHNDYVNLNLFPLHKLNLLDSPKAKPKKNKQQNDSSENSEENSEDINENDLRLYNNPSTKGINDGFFLSDLANIHYINMNKIKQMRNYD